MNNHTFSKDWSRLWSVDGKTLQCGSCCKVKDLTGQQFGLLKVISYGERKDNQTFWLCECQCHLKTKKLISGQNLKSGATRSCKDCRTFLNKHGASIPGGKFYKEYTIYRAMIARCYDESNHKYHRYGGRGIGVCEEWFPNKFPKFLEDMGPRPSKKHSIERIKNNKGYSKNNCKWALSKEQNRNRCDNIKITIKGETKLLVEWAEIYQINCKTARTRYKRWGPVPEIFTKPLRKTKQNLTKGVTNGNKN